MEAAKVEILREIQEAYALPEVARKKKIKQLKLKWHPDRNPPGMKFLANDCMAFITVELEARGALSVDEMIIKAEMAMQRPNASEQELEATIEVCPGPFSKYSGQLAGSKRDLNKALVSWTGGEWQNDG